MSFTGISGTQKIDRAAVEAPRAWIGAGPKSLLIDGRWGSAASGKTLETIDPSSEAVLALLAEGADIDVDAAVAAAQKALECKSWAGISPHQRARYLLQIADLVDRHAEG